MYRQAQHAQRQSETLAPPHYVEGMEKEHFFVFCRDERDWSVLEFHANSLVWSMDNSSLEQALNVRAATPASGRRTILVCEDPPKICVVTKAGLVTWKHVYESGLVPCYAKLVRNEHILVVFEHPPKVSIMDMRGTTVWEYVPGPDILSHPVHAELLANGNVLIADMALGRVIEVNGCGQIVWDFDTLEESFTVSRPRSIQRLSNGNTLICDAWNSRIIEVNETGKIVWRFGERFESGMRTNELFTPYSAVRLSRNVTLIADTGNARLRKVDIDQRLMWEYGESRVSHRLFGFPRSVAVLESNNLLVSDTYHNRILEVSRDNRIQWQYSDTADNGLNHPPLSPRSSSFLDDGSILVACGRTGRILRINRNGLLLWELSRYLYKGKSFAFEDLHDVILLDNGNYLVVDSERNAVLEVDTQGMVQWSYGLEEPQALRDPHRAVRLEDRSVVIADLGNSRIVKVREDGSVAWEINRLPPECEDLPAFTPRFCETTAGGEIVVLAGDYHSYLVALDGQGAFLWLWDGTLEEGHISGARWLVPTTDNRFVVSDLLNNRIVDIEVFE